MLNENSICLEVQTTDVSGGVAFEARDISMESVRQAQSIIATAHHKEEPEQMDDIDKAIRLLYPYSPRPGQREALHHLIFKGEDLILIAKTAFGKSMILQAASILRQKSLTVIIVPLDQIGADQAAVIKRIGGEPLFLNAKTINGKELEKLQKGVYTHVLISPELAISDRFRQTATTAAFQKLIGLVVVDEAHLVSQWGKDFRPSYSRLNQLRSILGSVPWFACSATLDSATLNSLMKNIDFSPNVKIKRTSINRPELLIRRAWIPKDSRSKFSALRFLFSRDGTPAAESALRLEEVPKTVVFFETRAEATACAREIRNWLQQRPDNKYTRKEAQAAVQVFHRQTGK